jgi:hypothetical protein
VAAAALALAASLSGCGSSSAGGSKAAPATTTTPSSFLPGIRHPAAGQFEPDDTKLESCAETDVACYEQGFGNLADGSGPEAALAELSTMLGQDVPAVRGDCHTIAHIIGSATLTRFRGDAASAMGYGSMICGSGYYHGLIEYALRGASTQTELVDKVKAMCSDTKSLNTTFLRYQCVHGLGHGVMIFSGNNLPWALSMCDKLADTWSQQSCSGGVFMQNFNPPNKLNPFRSSWVRKSDLLYPCDWVRVKYKFYCYLQITEHLLASTRYDWKRVAQLCESASKPWDGICFQSFGRDASGASRYRPEPAAKYCALAGAHIGDCVFGVARDFVNNDAKGERAAGFCRLVATAVRGVCFYGIGTILATFGLSQQETERTCDALAGRFAQQCLGFLSAADRRRLTSVTPGRAS